MSPGVTRLVALGASNLSLGLQTLLSTARGAWGGDVEILAAPGYGRSYGALSSIMGRTLPGILQCGIWSELARLKEAPARGFITDIGNDVLYGAAPALILEWVDEAALRLLAHTQDVVITDLPMDSVDRLSPAKFLFFRSLFFPSCRLSHDAVVERLKEVNAGVARLAASRGLRLTHLQPDWYGVDPIHIRPAWWSRAWGEILGGGDAADPGDRFSAVEWARLHSLPPDRRWFFGLEQATPQPGRRLKRGGRLWLY